MRRARPLRAEIVFRFDDAATEILLPDAVHDHARGQRILRADEPLARDRSRLAADRFVARNGCSTAGVPGVTSSAGRVKSPLMKTVVFRGSATLASPSCVTPLIQDIVEFRVAVVQSPERPDVRQCRRQTASASERTSAFPWGRPDAFLISAEKLFLDFRRELCLPLPRVRRHGPSMYVVESCLESF